MRRTSQSKRDGVFIKWRFVVLQRRRRGVTEREERRRWMTEIEKENYYFIFPPHVSTTNQQPHHHNYSSASAESPRGSEYKKTHRKQTFPHMNTSAAAEKKPRSTISFTCSYIIRDCRGF